MLTRISTLTIRNPVILASGVLGDSPTNLKAAYDAGAGAVVTKSITVEPRLGHQDPIIIPAEGGGWLNAVGLQNPGAVKFADILGRPNYPVIVSLAGSKPSEFESMIEMFEHSVGFELNLSCPNADGMGDYVGDDSELVGHIVEAAKSATDLPVFVKIGPYMTKSIDAAVLAGADGITAINTVPTSDASNTLGRSLSGNARCGLSGPPIKNTALQKVREIMAKHDVPVMGCGGISTWQDAAEFMRAGAVAVQVGSAAICDMSVLGQISAGLSEPEHLAVI